MSKVLVQRPGACHAMNEEKGDVAGGSRIKYTKGSGNGI